MADIPLDITLTGSLLTELEQPGVDAYAVWFDNNETNPQWTVMVNDGTLLNSGSIVQDGTTLAQSSPSYEQRAGLCTPYMPYAIQRITSVPIRGGTNRGATPSCNNAN